MLCQRSTFPRLCQTQARQSATLVIYLNMHTSLLPANLFCRLWRYCCTGSVWHGLVSKEVNLGGSFCRLRCLRNGRGSRLWLRGPSPLLSGCWRGRRTSYWLQLWGKHGREIPWRTFLQFTFAFSNSLALSLSPLLTITHVCHTPSNILSFWHLDIYGLPPDYSYRYVLCKMRS